MAWLTWISAGLFGALFLVHVSRVISKHCNCFRRRRGASSDVEKAILGTSRPPRGTSAALELGKEVRGRHYLSGGGGAGAQPPLQQQFVGGARNI